MLKKAIHANRFSTGELVRAAKAGDEEATTHLLTGFPPLTKIFASLERQLDPMRVAPPGELECAGRLAALEALRRFDPDRGVQFTTFAYRRIKGAMLVAMYPNIERSRAGGIRIRTVPLEDSEAFETPRSGPEEQLLISDPDYGREPGYERLERAEMRQAVIAFVNGLPPRQREIVRDLFWEGKTQAEVAKEHGVSRPAISRTLARVLRRGSAAFAVPRSEGGA